MAEAVRVKHDEEQRAGGSPIRLPSALGKLGEYPRRFKEFLHEVRVEMRNVTWPTPTDVRATTTVVIATVFFFGFFLFVIDRGASWVIELVFGRFKP